MIKLCMFDLDGTLIDSAPDLMSSMNHALKRNGLPLVTRDLIVSHMGTGLSNLIKGSIPADLYSEALIEKVRAPYTAWYTEHCADDTTVYPGVSEMLESLCNLKIKLAVITNKPHIFLDKVLRAFFPTVAFVRTIGAGEYPHKPDPAALLAVMEETGCKKAESAYVGDMSVDMETASRAGILSVGVAWGYQNREALKEAGAAHILEKPEELLKIIER